jgi:hypothetical protein
VLCDYIDIAMLIAQGYLQSNYQLRVTTTAEFSNREIQDISKIFDS